MYSGLNDILLFNRAQTLISVILLVLLSVWYYDLIKSGKEISILPRIVDHNWESDKWKGIDQILGS